MAISTMIDSPLDEVFIPYIEGSRRGLNASRNSTCSISTHSLDGMSVSLSRFLLYLFLTDVLTGVDTARKDLWRAP